MHEIFLEKYLSNADHGVCMTKVIVVCDHCDSHNTVKIAEIPPVDEWEEKVELYQCADCKMISTLKGWS